MTIRQKVARWIANLAPVRAQYEAARWSTLDRSYIPGMNTSASVDMSSAPRLEIMRKARYFEKNHPVPNKILELIETNVVGTGINPTPSSSSVEFNTWALNNWNQWSSICDVTSRQHFYSLQAVIARAQAVDGEIFVWLTKGETGNPRIQLIESHRCVDSDIKLLNERERARLALPIDAPDPLTCIDGIVVDARGRPQYYLITDDIPIGGKAGKVTAVPADEIVHFYEPSRAGQYRGLSIFHAILHILHDLDDLQRYEMLAAKKAASLADVIETESGEMPDGLVDRFRPAPVNTGPDTVINENARRQYYEQQFGGKTVALKRGDKLAQTKNERPCPAMRDFWEYLTANCCRGVGVSYAAYQDYAGNWGGAALRGAVVSDNSFYESRTLNMKGNLDRVYRHAIGSTLKDFKGEIPANWASVIWHPPRRASVDIGYESAAVINDLRAGLRTMEDIIGAGGGDFISVMTKRADEMAKIAELEKSRGLAPGTLSILFPNPPAVVSDAPPDSGGKKP